MGVILLVRHGQASFAADDYNVLSETGALQARRLGATLAAGRPWQVVTGSLRRQVETAEHLIRAAGWEQAPIVQSGWNEFDHGALVGHDGRGTDPAAFQDRLEGAMLSWPEAHPGDSDWRESFAEFDARCRSSLNEAVALSEDGPVLVVTSGGVIGWLAAGLLDGGVPQWIRLMRVCVNAGVTKLVSGRRGLSLVSFNDHSHLGADEVTYR